MDKFENNTCIEMKCAACGHHYKENWEEEPFVEIPFNDIEGIYACPKCGTLKAGVSQRITITGETAEATTFP